MNRALGEIPLTIKIRTGVKEGHNTAHKLMERLDGWNVGAVTVSFFCFIRSLALNPLITKTYLGTWKNSSTTIHKTCRLGVHQAMC